MHFSGISTLLPLRSCLLIILNLQCVLIGQLVLHINLITLTQGFMLVSLLIW